jgi:hypothetical protein
VSEPDADFKPVWVQRPVTVRALADALVTVRTFELIYELVKLDMFVKADTEIPDVIAAELARRRRRKLEILDSKEGRNQG